MDTVTVMRRAIEAGIRRVKPDSATPSLANSWALRSRAPTLRNIRTAPLSVTPV